LLFPAGMLSLYEPSLDTVVGLYQLDFIVNQRGIDL
jgi:hypothetical protein